jgi:hypothetical protein
MTPRMQTAVSLAILATLAVGCREPSPPPNVATETHAPVASPTVSSVPPVEATPASETRAAVRLSDDEMIALLVDSKLQRLTPEAARERLAATSDVRQSNPTSEGLQLRLGSGACYLLVSYLRGGQGEWIFGYARATMEASSEATATQSYERFKARLGERFGKPAWDQDGVVGWTVGEGAMEVSLLQRNDENGRFLIEATVAEPQGESEE